MTYPIVCDLDGVVWLGDVPIPGSTEAIARLRAAGHRCLFVTNWSYGAPAEIEAKLARQGISAVGDVVSSATAAAGLVAAGEHVIVCAGPGVAAEVAARGAHAVAPADVDAGARVDAVIVGFHTDFDFHAMRRASTAVRNGARFIATNDDATYPTAAGPIPGAGALVAGVATAAGAAPVIAGKPYAPIADLVRSVVTIGPDAIMVGDRPDTDGRFALTLGCRFGLVLTGVSAGPAVDPVPDLVAADLAALADLILAG